MVPNWLSSFLLFCHIVFGILSSFLLLKYSLLSCLVDFCCLFMFLLLFVFVAHRLFHSTVVCMYITVVVGFGACSQHSLGVDLHQEEFECNLGASKLRKKPRDEVRLMYDSQIFTQSNRFITYAFCSPEQEFFKWISAGGRTNRGTLPFASRWRPRSKTPGAQPRCMRVGGRSCFCLCHFRWFFKFFLRFS